MSVRPSDLHVSARYLQDGIREISHLGFLQKSFGKPINLVKIREKISGILREDFSTSFYIVHSSMKCFVVYISAFTWQHSTVVYY